MTKPTDKKLAIEWLRREKSMREGHEPTDYIDMAIEALKADVVHCGECKFSFEGTKDCPFICRSLPSRNEDTILYLKCKTITFCSFGERRTE